MTIAIQTSLTAIQQGLEEVAIRAMNRPLTQEEVARGLEAVRLQFNVDRQSFCQILSDTAALSRGGAYCETPRDDLRAIILGLRKGDPPFGVVFARTGKGCINYILRAQTIAQILRSPFLATQTLDNLRSRLDEKGIRYREEDFSLILDAPERGINTVEIKFYPRSGRFQKLSIHTPHLTAVYGRTDASIDVDGHSATGPEESEAAIDERSRLIDMAERYLAGAFLAVP